MELGMIGLGRMGANMTERLVRGGHKVVAYDRSREAVQRVAGFGAMGVDSLADFIAALRAPRSVWLMVPSGKPVDETIAALKGSIQSGDVVIDGGNSNYKDTMRRADDLKASGVDYIDCGTSGGIWGLKEGYSLMIGGARAPVERLTPIFQTLAPAHDKGWGHVGPSGAGHFVKMIHNGIEYGMMQAYAEGFAIIQRKKEFNVDLHQVSEIWRTGSVVRSWLLDLIADGLKDNPALTGIKPYVDDSGEGRWTASEAVDLDVPAPVITLSLLERLRSRDSDSFSDKLLAMMRHEFGGHAIKKD
ncbi:MAG TPA: decarboxylating 6-phosphogluconate dehydrogenase [Candidatus Binatia bacterium]|jgi:6-phosphogluconate dehydrogenase